MNSVALAIKNNPVALWLAVVAVSISAMVLVGGITRLTESGLSMVEWRPLLGAIPPMTEADWQESFLLYQGFPEYQQINQTMTLDEFKRIFFWEYAHRLLGRLIGFIFFVPYLLFTLQRKIVAPLNGRLLIAFILGGLQGLLGWYMVMSGLVDMPRVSHLRLAAHLLLALFLLAYIVWLFLDVTSEVNGSVEANTVLRLGLWLLVPLVVLQLVYGAFTAGMHAGYGFNTFPRMNGQWLADAATTMSPVMVNFIENPWMIQFVHRWLALGVLLTIVLLWLYSERIALQARQRFGMRLLCVVAIAQGVLGVSVLVSGVPIALASAHQGGAVLLVVALTYTLFNCARRANQQG